MLKYFLGAFLSIATSLLAKPSLTGSGYIPRSLSDNQFFLEITVKGLEAEKADLAADLKIYIKDYDPNVAIGYAQSKTSTTSVFTYSVNQAQEVVRETNNTFTTKVFLRVDGQSGVLEDLMEARTALGIQVEYTGADALNFTIQRDSAVANEAPSVESMKGGHLKVIARIATKDKIEFTSGSKAGSGVTFYVAKKGQGVLSLSALVYNASAAQDTEQITCQFNTSAGNAESCVSCGASQAYLLNAEAESQGVKVSTAKFGASSVSVTGLDQDDDDEYIGFLTYEPNGLQRSLCYTARPSANQTWSEMMDEDMDVKVGDPNCFVATVVGSSGAELQILRNWRDTQLLKSSWGRGLVWIYYRIGPHLADFVADKEWLKKPIHKLIQLWTARLVSYHPVSQE